MGVKGSDGKWTLRQMDCDKGEYQDLFSISKVPGLLLNTKRIKEGDVEYEVLDLSSFSYSRVVYYNITEGGEVFAIGKPNMGEVFGKGLRYFTSDGKYVANNNSLFELVGNDFERRIRSIGNAKQIMELPFIVHDCIGWNPNEDLVAFTARYPSRETSGDRTYIYMDGKPETNGKKVVSNPCIAAYNRKGEMVFSYDPSVWKLISYAQWYDKDNIAFLADNSIQMINVKNNQLKPIVKNVHL